MQIEKKYLSIPLTAQLEITDFCNHRLPRYKKE